MIKKIKLLTKIFLKDYIQTLNIINKKNNKLNKKSMITWAIIIFIITLTYLALKVIDFFQKAGKPILFIKIYLPIITTIMIIQIISLVCKIFYYSNDLEYLIPLPIKTTEIIISKFNTVIIVMYFTEALFLLIPMLMYGMLEARTILFFILMIITLIILPIMFVGLIGIIMLFAMKLSKFVKNQDFFQTILISILSFIIMSIEINYIESIILKPTSEELTQTQGVLERIDEINKFFIIINPLIQMLDNSEFDTIVINFAQVLIISLIPIIVFILLGNRLYLKNILQNKNNKKIINKFKYKTKNKTVEYLKKDIKKIIKNPTFFIQYIFHYLLLSVGIVLLLNIFIPLFMKEMQENNTFNEIQINSIKLQATLMAVGGIQLIFTFADLSITAISREGKSAFFIKYIPISLYKQFKIKTLPQICLNTVVVFMILTTIYLKVSQITIEYYIIAFILAMILNILNSYINLLLDLRNPNLNWVNDESLSKNNENKLYQYAITIIICLLLSYFADIFENIEFKISIISIIGIFALILILLKKYVKYNINKIFQKIS